MEKTMSVLNEIDVHKLLTEDFKFVFDNGDYIYKWYNSKGSCNKSIRVVTYFKHFNRAEIVFGYEDEQNYMNIGSVRTLHELNSVISMLININQIN